jgi:hypothetical protein
MDRVLFWPPVMPKELTWITLSLSSIFCKKSSNWVKLPITSASPVICFKLRVAEYGSANSAVLPATTPVSGEMLILSTLTPDWLAILSSNSWRLKVCPSSGMATSNSLTSGALFCKSPTKVLSVAACALIEFSWLVNCAS